MQIDFSLTVIVSSCDKYNDLWRPFFRLFEIYWPDCPFPVKLISEELKFELSVGESLCLGKGLDWSSLLLRALDRCSTRYVILCLDDFFLRKSVNTQRILHLLWAMDFYHLNMLRLTPRPGPERDAAGNIEYGTLQPSEPYRVSTQAALWRKDVLQRLLLPGESAWEFEVNGSRRANEIEGFSCVWETAFPYRHHVIEKGKWFPWAAWRFSRMGIGVDLSRRPVMSVAETIRWLTSKAFGPVARRLPPFVRRVVKPLIKELGW
ncbi:MAG: hypothetical protein AB1547_11665 [Thermodesulfobacteriota bacterium]